MHTTMRTLLARRTLLPLLAAAVAAGCSGEDDLLPECNPTASLSVAAVPALTVEVTDSVSGAARADGATGYAVTGALSVRLQHAAQDVAGLPTLYAYGPAGRYTVLVTRPGYEPWAASGVRVETDGCVPRTVSLRARLRPLAAGGS